MHTELSAHKDVVHLHRQWKSHGHAGTNGRFTTFCRPIHSTRPTLFHCQLFKVSSSQSPHISQAQNTHVSQSAVCTKEYPKISNNNNNEVTIIPNTSFSNPFLLNSEILCVFDNQNVPKVRFSVLEKQHCLLSRSLEFPAYSMAHNNTL